MWIPQFISYGGWAPCSIYALGRVSFLKTTHKYKPDPSFLPSSLLAFTDAFLAKWNLCSGCQVQGLKSHIMTLLLMFQESPILLLLIYYSPMVWHIFTVISLRKQGHAMVTMMSLTHYSTLAIDFLYHWFWIFTKITVEILEESNNNIIAKYR